jgi:hypothetical protein
MKDTSMSDFRRLFSHLWQRLAPHFDPASRNRMQQSLPPDQRVMVVVEGKNDIEFLRRISVILHLDVPDLPDLAAWERQGKLLFVPFGGSDIRVWTLRLAQLGIPQFYLMDREMPPATEARQQSADVVNLCPRCVARLTSKRTLENYLAPIAIREALGLDVRFSDDDHVPDVVAQAIYARQGKLGPWESLPPRSRKRRRDRAKKSLNTAAVERMTPARLAEKDPQGEVCSWLATIARLAGQSL